MQDNNLDFKVKGRIISSVPMNLNMLEYRFFDFENFGFCDWCCEQKFIPLDFLDRPNIGHYGPEAHKAFAEQILIPKLQELFII